MKGQIRLNIQDQLISCSLLNPARIKLALGRRHSNVGVLNGSSQVIELRIKRLREEVVQNLSMMTQYHKDRVYSSKARSSIIWKINNQIHQGRKYRSLLGHSRSYNQIKATDKLKIATLLQYTFKAAKAHQTRRQEQALE